MLVRFECLPLVAASLCIATIYVQDSPADVLAQRAAALASNAIQEQGASGVSVVVEQGGRPLLAAGYGYAGWEPDVRADEDTSYRIAPMLEHFLAVAVLRLVQDEKLSLDDELEKLLPELREQPWPGVELRHLLEQTSGVPDYTRFLGKRRYETFPQADVLAWLAKTDLIDAPGTCFEQNPTNLFLLGLIVESVTERSVQDWTQEQLFTPLGLDATHWCWAGRGPQPVGSAQLPFGAEGLCSSADDLGRWMRALTEGTAIAASGFELMTRQAQLADGTWTGWGMGFAAGNIDGLQRFVLDSAFADSAAHLAHYPEHDLTVVVMASGGDVTLAAFEQSLARAALQLPEPGVQDIALTQEEQEPYLGGYYVGCNRLGIVREGARLRLETSEGPWTVLLYQGEHRFIARDDPGMRLTFTVEEGRAESVLIEHYGRQTVGRRID